MFLLNDSAGKLGKTFNFNMLAYPVTGSSFDLAQPSSTHRILSLFGEKSIGRASSSLPSFAWLMLDPEDEGRLMFTTVLIHT